MPRRYFKRGEMAALARKAGIKPQNLSDILHRRRGVSGDMAQRLEAASVAVLKWRRIPALEWILNESSQHPAFFNKKRSKRRKTGA